MRAVAFDRDLDGDGLMEKGSACGASASVWGCGLAPGCRRLQECERRSGSIRRYSTRSAPIFF